MLGAIIGDIVGSRWEFNPTNNYNFKWLQPLTRYYGPDFNKVILDDDYKAKKKIEWEEGNSYTDDTICTVAVADAILHDSDFGESIHSWCRSCPCPMGGYGGRFSTWVNSENPKPYGSYGNGSAMRVSPVAYWYKSLDEVLDAAAATALPSHNHDEGIKGAQTVAMAIFRALQFGEAAADHIEDILSECVEFSGYDINIKKEDVINKFDETCQGTVPVALWIIRESTSFEDAIRKAVSLGADADTLGAIVGSIAEAIWGIPKEMKKEIMDYLPDEMKHVVNEFYDHIKKKKDGIHI